MYYIERNLWGRGRGERKQHQTNLTPTIFPEYLPMKLLNALVLAGSLVEASTMKTSTAVITSYPGTVSQDETAVDFGTITMTQKDANGDTPDYAFSGSLKNLPIDGEGGWHGEVGRVFAGCGLEEAGL